MVRGSVTTPVTALAAAVSGEARNDRPPLPWRPWKLRFEVLMPYCPGSSWSPFMAMHIEQPDSRHSAPAARKTSSQALALGLGLDLLGAGDDEHPQPSATCRPLQHGGRRAQVLDPAVGARADEDDVDRLAGDRLAGLEAHVVEGALEAAPLGRVRPARPGSGCGR